MGLYERKRAVITRGASGIGLATAKLLVGQGARVIVTGRAKATLDSARQELGDNTIVVESDASSLSAIVLLAETVKSEFGSWSTVRNSSAAPAPA